MSNEYVPYPARVKSIRKETPDTSTFTVAFQDEARADSFEHAPGQFVQVSVLGVGEVPISIASSPLRRRDLELTIRAAGSVTRALHRLRPGDGVHIRGPYGTPFSFEHAKGKNLHFIAGGIGLAPLRSLIHLTMHCRSAFGAIYVMYGARNPVDICFRDELRQWQDVPNSQVRLSVDRPDEHWQGHVGVVTSLWQEHELEPTDGVAYVCGPPVMMRYVVEKLIRTGFAADDIYLLLERYMKCGVGKCGHCNVGGRFVCTDGPVFSYGQLGELPAREWLL